MHDDLRRVPGVRFPGRGIVSDETALEFEVVELEVGTSLSADRMRPRTRRKAYTGRRQSRGCAKALGHVRQLDEAAGGVLLEEPLDMLEHGARSSGAITAQ